MSELAASPEEAATNALLAVLREAFTDDDQVEVWDAVPDEGLATRSVNVWVGGHNADEDFASVGGARGPSLSTEFRIEVFINSGRPGDAAAEVRRLTLAAVHTVRLALRAAIVANTPIEVPNPAGTARVSWQRLIAHRSTGPLPNEAGGWTNTAQADVAFTVRIS